jgi:hypothetical protein
MENQKTTGTLLTIYPDKYGSTITFPSFGQDILRHKDVQKETVLRLPRIRLSDRAACVRTWRHIGCAVVGRTEHDADEELRSLGFPSWTGLWADSEVVSFDLYKVCVLDGVYLLVEPSLMADLFSAGAWGGANLNSPTGGAAYLMLEKL